MSQKSTKTVQFMAPKERDVSSICLSVEAWQMFGIIRMKKSFFIRDTEGLRLIGSFWPKEWTGKKCVGIS